MRHPVLFGAAAISAAGAAVLGQILESGDRKIADVGLVAGIAMPFTVLGVLVLISIPRHPVGVLMIAAGGVASVHLVSLSWTVWTPLAWLSQWLWWPTLGLVFWAVLLFPTGRLPSSRWWPAAVAVVGGTTLTSGLVAIAALGQPRIFTDYRLERAAWVDAMVDASHYTGLLTGLGCLAAALSLVVRWWRSESGSDERLQLACMLPCGLLLVAGVVLSVYGVPAAWSLVAWSVPFGMTAAILRYRLFDIDLIVNRTIVWLVLTALVIGVVALAVKLLSDVLFSVAEGTAAMMASGLVVVTFEPLHRRVQHSVDHLMYGDRDDPYRVIARLGSLLRATVDPTAVMPLVTDTIVQSLQVPYVAMELAEGDGRVVAARSGRRVDVTESFDMVAHGETVGRLIVGRRSSGSGFSRHERALLEDLAVQAGIAAEASQLTRDLQNLRDRLVARREGELLRLRRELHDRLGPGFTGLRMQVLSARRAAGDEGRLSDLLQGIDQDLATCSRELREVVDQMRPPALDHGLEAAVRAECARFGSADLDVEGDIDGDLTGLPTAVEVAAYRIVAEALTNVARHARASRCRVRVQRSLDLVVVVSDDGQGVQPGEHRGIGTDSMGERAAELGGTCTIESAPDGGTAVTVRLPIGRAHLAAHSSSENSPPSTPNPTEKSVPA